MSIRNCTSKTIDIPPISLIERKMMKMKNGQYKLCISENLPVQKTAKLKLINL